jgi:hypothetical protein
MAAIDTFSGSHQVNFGALVDPGTQTTAEDGTMAAVPQNDTMAANPLGGSTRLYQLLTKLQKLLSEPYAFDVFATNSINFGIMVTYRQKWVPQNYQVGELVSTIPLAPKETRRYTTRKVTKKTRSTKELEDQLQTRKTESTDTARVESEIVAKAQEKTNFDITAKESLGGKDSWQIESTQDFAGEQAKQSERTKKDIRESVTKSAQEYKQQHRMEIETTESSELEETTFQEIQNPNDELTVTYLFYELQRTYRISEKIHKLTPVILVANEMPAPDEIDDAWLIEHDWIIRRTILDDSFRPALDYLTTSFVGAEVNIRILEANVLTNKNIVLAAKQQLGIEDAILHRDEQDLLEAVRDLGASHEQQGMVDIVKRIFDPIGITGQANTGVVSAAEAMVDYAKDTRDRADRERARLLAQLDVAMTALQGAVDKLSAAVREHYARVAEVDRLRMHVKDNILYYMQAIWSHEPPDQRFFRLYNIDVPFITPKDPTTNLTVGPGSTARDALLGRETATVKIDIPDIEVKTKKLVEVADLDTVLGYKGNYTIFALKNDNVLTLHMMQDYLDLGDREGMVLRDPDEVGGYTVDEIERLAACLYAKDKDLFRQYRDELKQMLINRLNSTQNEDDLVIVPTSSLYIEALVGTHPLLEDFKLLHRALDVKKVQAEVRHAELENIRLAARALEGERGDPDIEKKIVVETEVTPNIALDPEP